MTITAHMPARPYGVATLAERAEICALLHAANYPPVNAWDALRKLRLAEAAMTARSITDLPADLQPGVRAALAAARSTPTD